MALHVRHRTPCDVISMPECACLQLKAVVAYCSLVYFRLSYTLFCFACFVVVPCVLHMRPNKPHCYNKPGVRRYCDLQYNWKQHHVTAAAWNRRSCREPSSGCYDRDRAAWATGASTCRPSSVQGRCHLIPGDLGTGDYRAEWGKGPGWLAKT